MNYKNTPKLRFKEFNYEYKKAKYKDVLKIKSGKVQKQIECENGIYPILGTGGQIGKTNSFLYNKPSVLIGRKGTINKPQYMDTPFWTVDTLFYSHVYESNLPKYLFYSFQNVNWKKYDESTGVPSLSTSTIENIDCYIPTLSEQIKISNFLTLLDKKIELQCKKIEAFKLYKIHTHKNLFRNNIVRTINMSQLGNIITGTTPPKNEGKYWNNGDIVWITPSDINRKRDIDESAIKLTKEGLNKGRYIPKNSILVTCIASIGKNAILKVDGSCNQQINAIVPNKEYNYNYIYYLIENISKEMNSFAGKSATSILNKEQFCKLILRIHNREWQDKIDNILSNFDKKIDFEYDKINKLNELKKGLMQSMFV